LRTGQASSGSRPFGSAARAPVTVGLQPVVQHRTVPHSARPRRPSDPTRRPSDPTSRQARPRAAETRAETAREDPPGPPSSRETPEYSNTGSSRQARRSRISTGTSTKPTARARRPEVQLPTATSLTSPPTSTVCRSTTLAHQASDGSSTGTTTRQGRWSGYEHERRRSIRAAAPGEVHSAQPSILGADVSRTAPVPLRSAGERTAPTRVPAAALGGR